jgi:hypothetical protein
MKRILTSVAVATVAAVASGGLLAGLAATAQAAAAPPWEPDASSVGGLIFYNAAGHAITSGSTKDAPIAAYVEGAAAIRSGDTKATLEGFLPVSGEKPGQWSGEALSGSTTYPSSTAPAPLKSATLPVVTGGASDLSVADLVADFPTTSKPGYKNVYQLRLVTSGPQESVTPQYDSADIAVSGSTWSLVFDGSAVKLHATKVTLKASKTSIKKGKKLSLTVKEAPAIAGKVSILDGSKKLATVTVKNGKAKFATKKLKVGNHKLRAKFTPSSSTYAVSTSKAVKVKVSK